MDDKHSNTYTRLRKNALAAFSNLRTAHGKLFLTFWCSPSVPTALITFTHPALLTLVLKIRLLETYLDDLGSSGHGANQ
jgi:hypothetical protein